MFENNTLYGKLENLENVFIGSAIQRDGLASGHGSGAHTNKLSHDYTTSTLMLENNELKKKIARLEEEKLELKQALLIQANSGGGGGGAAVVVSPDASEMYQLRQSNQEL